jgi:hypothetical protein
MRENKREGISYEALFMHECMKRGLDPHLTVGDFLPHDIAVLNQAGKFFRVQVKGTGTHDKYKKTSGTEHRYNINITRPNRSKASIDCSKVDVWAVYVDPVDEWYLIPCLELEEAAPGTVLRVYPHTKGGSKAATEKFRGRWDIFKKWDI